MKGGGRKMTEKFNRGKHSDSRTDWEHDIDSIDSFDAVPLILPDDFSTPPDLDERILREMSELRKELDKKESQRKERTAHAMRFLIRVTATAAALALFVMITPLRNYMVSASDDVKSWIKDISSENSQKIKETPSNENNDGSFDNYYIVSDKDFKGGIAHGDTVCIIPDNGEKDYLRIVKKIRSVTNTGEEQGRDYFHVSITDSNRIIVSVTNRVQKHAHLLVEIVYEDGSTYRNEWDLITSRPLVRFNPNSVSCGVGEIIVPKYYVVVLDEHEKVRTANYLKGTDRITWSTTDESVATVDEKGTVTGVGEGFAILQADTGFGNVGKLRIKVTGDQGADDNQVEDNN